MITDRLSPAAIVCCILVCPEDNFSYSGALSVEAIRKELMLHANKQGQMHQIFGTV